jgi:hypothetical protein
MLLNIEEDMLVSPMATAPGRGNQRAHIQTAHVVHRQFLFSTGQRARHFGLFLVALVVIGRKAAVADPDDGW